MSYLAKVDPAIAAVIEADQVRQASHLNLIASENLVSRAVLEAQGSVLTNKYAEGYPGKRYYGGCEHVDSAERLAIERAKQLFGAEYVNVQPHSGTQANAAVYLSYLQPGDTILSMSLAHGGHLSHGHKINLAGRIYTIEHYGVDRETERLVPEQVGEIAERVRPKLIIVGGSAYSRAIEFAPFRTIADSVGARLMVDMAHFAGLVAAGLHPDPVPHADYVTTTTHKTLRGPRGGMILARKKYAKKLKSAVFPGMQGGPLMHVIAAKAVAFKEGLEPAFKGYQQHIKDNAAALAAALSARGYRIVSGGTDTHLMLVDLRPKGLKGNACEAALGEAGIIVNMNLIPFDPEKAMVTSGLRLGTPTLSSRGMRSAEMDVVAGLIDRVLSQPGDAGTVETVRAEVAELCRAFPIPDLYGEAAAEAP